MKTEKKPLKWCAIYTRKSTDENLRGEFTSLDAQRDYCRKYIEAREGEGWRMHPAEYTDAGFTGGNMDRPALKRLMADVRAGKIQGVVAYKFDRLTRNTLDFLQLLEVFDRHGVTFTAVTQPIDTGSSMGRLMRSILMDFAQFERELISERTRDKRAAMAAKGMWPGGHPPLGYDADPKTKRLKVNAEEAKQVRSLYEMYLQAKSLSKAAKLANEQGLRMKRFQTKAGPVRGGKRWNKVNLDYVLRNPVYLGKIRHKDQEFDGQHEAILDAKVYERALRQMTANGERRKSTNQDKHNFLLRGLVRCAACGSLMTPNFAYSKGRKYFYYKCVSVNQLDKTACPTRSAPARELERWVIDRLGYLGGQKAVVAEIVERARRSTNSELPEKKKRRVQLIARIGRMEAEVGNITGILAAAGQASPQYRAFMDKLGQVQGEREGLEKQVQQFDAEILELETRQIDAELLRRNLADFAGNFDKLTPEQQKRFTGLLVSEVLYDAQASKMRLTLRPLPDLGFQVAGDKVSFDESLNWLRD